VPGLNCDITTADAANYVVYVTSQPQIPARSMLPNPLFYGKSLATLGGPPLAEEKSDGLPSSAACTDSPPVSRSLTI